MTDVASKQQRTALFLSTIITRTWRHTELKETDKPYVKPVLCQRTFSSDFVQFFTQLNCTGELGVYGALMNQTSCLQLHSHNWIWRQKAFRSFGTKGTKPAKRTNISNE